MLTLKALASRNICRHFILGRAQMVNSYSPWFVSLLSLMKSTKMNPLATYSAYVFSNLVIATMYSFCAYFYFCTMVYEPGYVPKLGGLTQQKALINELLGLWKFDDQNFCVPCMVRMPLRSKHCKRCNRCIAKHDQ